MEAQESLPHIRFFVDPACPWAWLTSRWVTTLEEEGVISATLSLFSLYDKNAEEPREPGAELPSDKALRIMAGAREEGGEEGIRRMYTALGEAHHELDQPLQDLTVLNECASAAGFSGAFVEHCLSRDDTMTQVLADHNEALLHGVFGVPSLLVEGHRAFFGPVLDARLDPGDARRLWHAVAPLLVFPHFFELKQERLGPPHVGRYEKRAAAAHAH